MNVKSIDHQELFIAQNVIIVYKNMIIIVHG